MKTLFGEIEFRPPSKCQGHADVPGHGPKGETCGTCQHIVRVRGGSRNYLKCEGEKPASRFNSERNPEVNSKGEKL